MATTYTLDWSSPSKTPITLAPGAVDNTTPMKLYGENSFLWGEGTNENFMHLLENFASDTAPANPTLGMDWYDTSTGEMNTWTSSGWQQTGGGGGGSGGDAFNSQSPAGETLLWFTGDISIYQTGTLEILWNRARRDPFGLYSAGGGYDVPITATPEIRFPPTANFMRVEMNCTLSFGTVGNPGGSLDVTDPRNRASIILVDLNKTDLGHIPADLGHPDEMPTLDTQFMNVASWPTDSALNMAFRVMTPWLATDPTGDWQTYWGINGMGVTGRVFLVGDKTSVSLGNHKIFSYMRILYAE